MSKNEQSDSKNDIDLWDLSDPISGELKKVESARWLIWFASWTIWLIMVGGFVVGWLWLWPTLETLNVESAVFQATKINGLMYKTNFGFGLLFWLFAWIMMSASIAGVLVRVTPMPIKGILFFGVLEDSGGRPFNHKALSYVLGRRQNHTNTTAFLNLWAMNFIPRTLKYALPIALIGAVTLSREINTYSVFSEDGYYRSSFFPWSQSTLLPWSDAEFVELGCNQTDDGGAIVYEITFTNGKSVRISDDTPATNTSWLNAIEVIDQKLVNAGVAFKRWEWLDRDPLHPKCLRGFYGQFGMEQSKRLRALLRVGMYEVDVFPN